VIRIDSLSKRHGRQILFLEASAVVNRGEKVGLVGPNGAGKTTIFRLITREEEPDDGQVSIDRGTTVGYFSQDIGEMKGRTVVEATLDGAGPVSDAARALHELEHALADPARANQMESLVDRYGEAQARFEELGGYGLEARAREVLAGLGFEPAQMDGDVGALSGGWKMRVGLARIPHRFGEVQTHPAGSCRELHDETTKQRGSGRASHCTWNARQWVHR